MATAMAASHAAATALAATSSISARLAASSAPAHSHHHHVWASLPGLTSRALRATGNPHNVDNRGNAPGAGGRRSAARAQASGESSADKAEGRIIHGRCFVVGDNIDTDQIIPAEYLTLVPSKPDEYEKLGSYAMIGLPAHYGKFIEEGKTKSEYKVMIAGANFGCGSSREHAPVAMGAAGVRAVVAESYARIFFRNSVATGELYPVETEARICDENKTGDLVTVDLEHDLLINHTSGKQFPLIPIGDAGPVIDAGGIFNFARASGMIASPA